MKPKLRTKVTVAVTTLLLVAPLGAAADTGPDGTLADAVDPAYEFSVADVESPSAVRERAMELLGDRYVDLWISEDQTTYVVAAVALVPGEADTTATALTQEAPVRVVERFVSRDALDDFAEGAIAAIADESYSAYWVDYDLGALVVTAPDGAVESIAESVDVSSAPERLATARSSAAAQAPHAPRVIVEAEELDEEESATANPYRAGKKVSVGGTTANCTTSFLIVKDDKKFGVTAGHCGKNGSSVRFAGVDRGNIRDNTLWASNPAKSDAALFHMVTNGSGTLYRSSTLNRKVAGSYATADIVKGLRVCVRGSFSGGQTCGPITETQATTWSGTASRDVKNGYRWKWDGGPGTTGGDSGGPMYRVLSDGRVRAIGVHRAGNKVSHSYFTPWRVVTAGTGGKIVVTN